MLQAVKAPTERFKLGRVGWSLVSLLALVTLWEIAALIAESRYVPGPWTVIQAMIREAKRGELWSNIAATLIRVAFSFVIAMFIGSAIGLALGKFKGADLFFDSWLIFFLNLPALVIIILCYIWFGLTEVARILFAFTMTSTKSLTPSGSIPRRRLSASSGTRRQKLIRAPRLRLSSMSL